MPPIASSLLIVVVAIVALWLVASLLGFQVALGTSLVLSIALTVGLTLLLNLFRRR